LEPLRGFFNVMPGPVPGIHVFTWQKDLQGWDKPAADV
jgi:hypothetical protein